MVKLISFLGRKYMSIYSKLKKYLGFPQRSPDTDFVKISGEPTWNSPYFMMKLCHGQDQVTRELSNHGWKSFEKPMPHYFANIIQKLNNGLFIDVGANTGFYSLLALSVSKKIRIEAYEPVIEIFHILKKNIDKNGYRKRALIFPYAISDKSGDGYLYIPDNSHGLIETSASLSSNFKESIMEHRSIKKYSLDELYCNSQPVNIIKIDAEGHDLEVLTGAQNIIKRDRPIIFIEVLLGSNEEEMTNIIKNNSYKDYVLFQDGLSRPNNSIIHETLAWNHILIPEEKIGILDK